VPESAGHSRPLSEDLADAAMEMAAILGPRRAHHRRGDPQYAHRHSPAVSDLVYRGLRGWGLAQVRLARMAKKPPEPEISALLAITWAALLDGMRATHVMVDEAVSAAKKLTATRGQPRSKADAAAVVTAGFVNAILRKTLAEPEAAAQDLLHPQARWNAPAWWIDRICQDWPQQGPDILDALQRKGPLTVRVNLRCGGSMAAYGDELRRQGFNGTPVGPQAIVIEPAVPVMSIPGFADGRVSIQDAAAQNICGIFDGLAKERRWDQAGAIHILDACAAPGGKSVALAQAYKATIWAMDASAERLQALGQDLPRVA
jgi:16S rRNA (cytosine967-C5)-methyltransferase